jgi:DNA topoisomerase I
MSPVSVLMVVESGTKAKTITKLLQGDLPGLRVEATMGHLLDLPLRDDGVSHICEEGPHLRVLGKRRADVLRLQQASASSDCVLLATDADREGEAIAQEVAQLLDIAPDCCCRIEFREITRSALLRSIAEPRCLDVSLVRAQHARRLLDRIVGYGLSRTLRTVLGPEVPSSRASTGRVQVAALGLVVQREDDILLSQRQRAAKQAPPDSYLAVLEAAGLSLRLWTKGKRGPEVLTDTAKAAIQLATQLRGSVPVVASSRKVVKRPMPAFSTSSLQQVSSGTLGLSPSATMSIAQQLYELGWITYPRTDSTRVSQEFVDAVSRELGGPTVQTPAAASSGAHEAVRVTQPAETNPGSLSSAQRRLYKLVWERSVASVRPPTTVMRHQIRIPLSQSRWFQGSVEGDPQPTMSSLTRQLTPPMTAQLVLSPTDFAKIPRRFSEATLVAELDDRGVGRPSTFASIVGRLVDKMHVTHTNNTAIRKDCGLLSVSLQNGGRRVQPMPAICRVRAGQRGVLRPTLLAREVCRCVRVVSPEILDSRFTAHMEQGLDAVAAGKASWLDLLRSFMDACTGVTSVPDDLLSQLQSRVPRHQLRNMEAREFPEHSLRVRLSRFGPVVECTSKLPEGVSPFVGLRGLLQQLQMDHMELDHELVRAVWDIRKQAIDANNKLVVTKEHPNTTLHISRHGLYTKGAPRLSREEALRSLRNWSDRKSPQGSAHRLLSKLHTVR